MRTGPARAAAQHMNELRDLQGKLSSLRRLIRKQSGKIVLHVLRGDSTRCGASP